MAAWLILVQHIQVRVLARELHDRIETAGRRARAGGPERGRDLAGGHGRSAGRAGPGRRGALTPAVERPASSSAVMPRQAR